jgi:hypothetical protein
MTKGPVGMWATNLIRRRTADPVLPRQAAEVVEAAVEVELQLKVRACPTSLKYGI